MTFRRILFATDLSEASRRAFQEALALAKSNQAELVLAHAYEPPSSLPRDSWITPAAREDFVLKLREEADSKLQPMLEKARREGVSVRSQLLDGVPDQAILEAAGEIGADLLVLGTHGRTGPARLFLGSVASRVISRSTCPVLTVRAA